MLGTLRIFWLLFFIFPRIGTACAVEVATERIHTLVETARLRIGSYHPVTLENPGDLDVIEKATGETIGTITLNVSGAGDFHLPLGMLRKRMGYGLEAKKAMLEFAFGTLQLGTCIEYIGRGNEASIRFHEKLGFKPQGKPKRRERTLVYALEETGFLRD